MQELKVKYNNGAIHDCGSEWDWNFGPMTDFDLWAVLAGEGTLEINGKKKELHPGSIALFIPGCSGYGAQDPDNPLKVAAIHFDFIGLSPVEDFLYIHVESPGFIGELMRHAMISAGNGNQSEADFWLSGALRKILPTGQQSISQRFHSEIDHLCEEIINNPEKPYNVNDMAKKFFLCKDHFTRVFKSYKKINPRNFVIKARIERACSLLLNTNLNAFEIADRLGYSSVNFLCRQFKAQTGKTLLQYRRKTF